VAVISRFSTAAEISKEVSHEVDLFSFMRSAFDHAEGICLMCFFLYNPIGQDFMGLLDDGDRCWQCLLLEANLDTA